MPTKNIIIGAVLTLITALLIAATGWNFKATAEIPEKYVLRSENEADHRAINKKLDRIYELILELHMQEHEEPYHEEM